MTQSRRLTLWKALHDGGKSTGSGKVEEGCDKEPDEPGVDEGGGGGAGGDSRAIARVWARCWP